MAAGRRRALDRRAATGAAALERRRLAGAAHQDPWFASRDDAYYGFYDYIRKS